MRKADYPMPTHEERLSTLEQTVAGLGKGIRDIYHNETVLLGLVSEQGKDIREMKISLGVLNERLGAFEQSVDTRFGTLEQNVNDHFGAFEQSVDTRFGTLETRLTSLDGRLNSFEQSVDTRFGVLEIRLTSLDGRLNSFEQSIDTRFGTLEHNVNDRFEAQDQKLDQVLLLLNTLIPKSEQDK